MQETRSSNGVGCAIQPNGRQVRFQARWRAKAPFGWVGSPEVVLRFLMPCAFEFGVSRSHRYSS